MDYDNPRSNSRTQRPDVGMHYRLEAVVERLLLVLLANGNLLLGGLPGLAKTRAIKSMAKYMESKFSPIQFTPDLLPSELTGSEISGIMTVLVKQTTLAFASRDKVAGLSGKVWLAFLDSTYIGRAFTEGPGKFLLELSY